MIIVGSVIKANTKPPANGDDLGSPKKFKNIAKPNNPKTMEGTAAKLLILTSIIFVILFLGANSLVVHAQLFHSMPLLQRVSARLDSYEGLPARVHLYNCG